MTQVLIKSGNKTVLRQTFATQEEALIYYNGINVALHLVNANIKDDNTLNLNLSVEIGR